MTFIRQVALLAIFLIATLPAQQRSPSDSLIIPVLGTVKAISGNVIYVDSGGHVTSVFTDDHTELWKGKTSHDLSLVLVGDDFAGRFMSDLERISEKRRRPEILDRKST